MTLMCSEIFESAHLDRASEYEHRLCKNKAPLEIIVAIAFEWSPEQESFWAKLPLDSAQNPGECCCISTPHTGNVMSHPDSLVPS